MNGHQALINLRRSGKSVPAVYVTDGPVWASLDKHWPDPIKGSNFAHIRIEPSDVPEALDLRCVVGMLVHIEGDSSESRMKRLHDAFVAAKPKAVATTSQNNFWIYHRG